MILHKASEEIYMDIAERIRSIEITLNITLPQQYIDLITKPMIYYDHCSIYSIEDIANVNISEEIATFCPGFVLIGDDNGDNRIIMRSGRDQTEVYIADTGDLFHEPSQKLSDDLLKWVSNGCVFNDGGKRLFFDIILTQFPSEHIFILSKIKRILNLSMTSTQFMDIAKKAPVVLMSNINEGEAYYYRDKLSEYSKYISIRKK